SARPRVPRDRSARRAGPARARRADGGSRPRSPSRPVGLLPRAGRVRNDAPGIEPRDGRGGTMRPAPAAPRRLCPRRAHARGAPAHDGSVRPRYRVPPARRRRETVTPARTAATAARVVSQLRRDPRTLALLLVVPCALMVIVDQLFVDNEQVFQSVGVPML